MHLYISPLKALLTRYILTGMSYNNPIIPGFNPDPSIVRVDKDFFLVTSTFEYFPGVPIYHSQDLIQWKLIGHALTRPSQLQIHTPEPGGGVWATTIRYHKGIYYIIAASFQRYRPQQDDRVWPQGFYVKTTDIWDEKTWSDPIYFDQVGFDQDVSLDHSPKRIAGMTVEYSFFGMTMEPYIYRPLTERFSQLLALS